MENHNRQSEVTRVKKVLGASLVHGFLASGFVRAFHEVSQAIGVNESDNMSQTVGSIIAGVAFGAAAAVKEARKISNT